MGQFFADEDFEAQFLRTIAKTQWATAEAGECLAVAERITDGDRESWRSQWWQLAEEVAQQADACAAAGHEVSAAQAYGRASEYARESYIFARTDLADPFLLQAWQSTRTWFQKMLHYGRHRHELIPIGFENKQLTCYLLFPTETPKALIVTPSGYDAPIEEFYSLVAAPALQRGYAVAMYEGPGQGGAVYVDKLYMRADWETVSSAVVAQLRSVPGLADLPLIGMGRSFGGYLAPRAAAMTTDFDLLVADPALLNLGTLMAQRFPAGLMPAIVAGDKDVCAGFDAAIASDPHKLAFFTERAVVHGVNTPSEYVRELVNFVVPAQQISCPTLVTAQPDDAETRAFFAALTCEKDLIAFDPAEGAGGHCEGAGQARFAQRVFDWLDERVAVLSPKA